MIVLIGIQFQFDGYHFKKCSLLVVLRLHCCAGFSPAAVRIEGCPSSCNVRASHRCGWSPGVQAPGHLSFSVCSTWAPGVLHSPPSCGAGALLFHTAREIFRDQGSNPPVLQRQEDSTTELPGESDGCFPGIILRPFFSQALHCFCWEINSQC